MKTWFALLPVCSLAAHASLEPLAPRTVVPLDGVWQIEQGTMEAAPASFSQTVVVPGLVDMAQPGFTEVGQPSDQREAFWYRRTFRLVGPVPEIAVLKIHKARYGTRVVVNGRPAGDHLPCFTPAYINVQPYLEGDGGENEVMIRVGANRESLPQDMPTGWDFEKYRFLPGIYDSVELILTRAPYIVNVQSVPDLAGNRVRILAEIRAGLEPCDLVLEARVTEARTGRVAGQSAVAGGSLEPGQLRVLDLTLPIAECRWWSPEDPFLYQLELNTGADAVRTRFGMRSFRFDPAAGRAMLNGRTYYLRGSNVTIYRFFEDHQRADRPWRVEWVRRLHRQFKTMHWNSLRYCIGFPPELWYDIADEEGFLIQDEFPIWLLDRAPENPVAAKIIPEYTAWMRERWNHPCVVIWDAQNESHTAETGKALQAVRHLDLSNRPWENGWAAPQSPIDCVESHPYLFIRAWQKQEPFRLRDLAQTSGRPRLTAAQQRLPVPIVINEYAWLWLDREGTPTCLTDRVYESLLGPQSSADQRRRLYARYLAALTEFWRAHRQCAGVLHFCGLGYSRPGDRPRPEGGATSDHFLDLESLAFEPYFAEYVREAFNPLGLMLDFWEDAPAPGEQRTLRVFVLNDREADWQGAVRLELKRDYAVLSSRTQRVVVPGLGREIVEYELSLPSTPGRYTLRAELQDTDRGPIRSRRDFEIR